MMLSPKQNVWASMHFEVTQHEVEYSVRFLCALFDVYDFNGD